MQQWQVKLSDKNGTQYNGCTFDNEHAAWVYASGCQKQGYVTKVSQIIRSDRRA